MLRSKTEQGLLTSDYGGRVEHNTCPRSLLIRKLRSSTNGVFDWFGFTSVYQLDVFCFFFLSIPRENAPSRTRYLVEKCSICFHYKSSPVPDMSIHGRDI